MSPTLKLFEAFGIELEYMIVDRQNLNIMPIADRIIDAVAGDFVNEITQGATSWSNELALHVIETKFTKPSFDLHSYMEHFHQDIRQINEILAPHNACLLPTAMHPWMDPLTETRLWPHELNEIYTQFNAIFNCQGHGWSNLQSMHINLPFSDDEEFYQLHRAIRAIIPLLPALAASSPIVEGQVTGKCDNRLFYYQNNCKRIPLISGRVVPEPIPSIDSYHQTILEPMYKAIHPLDPKGILAHEWLNARGAIARFERMAIEIRVLDIQECPRADLSYAHLIIETIKALVAGQFAPATDLDAISQDQLANLFQKAWADGPNACLEDERLAQMFGVQSGATLDQVWQHLNQALIPADSPWKEDLNTLLEAGCLSQRIVQALGPEPNHATIHHVYNRLANCLATNQFFL